MHVRDERFSMTRHAGRCTRYLGRAERGTSSLELALIVPSFLLLLVGAIDLSWLVILSNMTSEAAREGARAAKVNVAPTPGLVSNAAATPIAAAARNQVVAYGPGGYDVTSTVGGNGQDGYYVQVVVSTTYQPVSGSFLPVPARSVNATSRLFLP